MQLVNAESNIREVGNNQEEGYYNYFIGNDQSKWASNVPLYGNVELQGVYRNIDVKYYYDNGMLRYDYKAKPGADISQIKFKFEGQESLSINSNGELILKTSIGQVTNGKIYAYQMEGETQKEVQSQFEQREDGTVGLKAESYDSNKELIIDPLVYYSNIGGSIYNVENSMAVDAGGNAYITGWTESTDYPTTSGAYQDTLRFLYNAFITKLNPTGTALVYSTFLGGDDSDFGNSITLNTSGNAYITGIASSSNFPTTSGAYQTNGGGGFVTQLDTTGSSLIYSTFIGACDALSIALDANGNAYITGTASSSYFPTTTGAFQNTPSGIFNTFVTKLNPSGSALVYSTFIGGNNYDFGNSITVDANGNAYITGSTSSTNFPTTTGAYQTTYLGDTTNVESASNVFVTKINSSGSALVYSTYIGGYPQDKGNSIAIDDSGNAFITGYTYSSNFPTTSGAFQTTFLGGPSIYIYKAFVTKLNSSGTNLLYSTFIEGMYGEGTLANSIVIDDSGNAYITGSTSSPDFPTTNGAYQTVFSSDDHVFLTELNSTGSGLVYSTFLGGSDGKSLVIDSSGNAYISGVYQTNISNLFVTKLNMSAVTFVKLNILVVPNKFELFQNYPNPFNPSTTINFSVPKTSLVTIKVYNILGKELSTLVNEEKSAGNYSVQFFGSKLSSGIYFYRMQAGSFSQAKKLLLLK